MDKRGVAVSDAEFSVAGGNASGVVGLPIEARGGAALRLVTVRNEKLYVDGTYVRSNLLTDAQYLEQFERSRNA